MISSSILVAYQPGGLIFQCPIFLPFHTVHGILRASPMAQGVQNLLAMQETQETRVQFLGWEDPLEKDMVTHSSILALRIPRTKEPVRL